ncbi:hypothetical protein [Glycomyces sp. NPDC047010]|uniref:hypothetical protein n=1 Tax=Glycomyces sp. NPDC047010 TaxID=3155023 RepID=UPI00340E228F
MAPTSDRPVKPRSIGRAQAGLWLQYVYLLVDVLLTSQVTNDSFGAHLLTAAGQQHALLLFLVGLPALGVGAGLLTLMLGDRIPGARTAAVFACAALALATCAAAATSPSPLITFATALPWLALQAMTFFTLHTPDSDRWFTRHGDVESAS